jgi:hypothetical protein
MNSRTARVGLVILFTLAVGTTEEASQTAQLKRLMRQKLEVSEKLLEAVVTSNWAELVRRSRSLEELTNDPAWAVLKTPEYGRQSSRSYRPHMTSSRPPRGEIRRSLP